MNLIKVSENDVLTNYLMLDSLVVKDDRVQCIEVINFKVSELQSGEKMPGSTKVFEVIDLSTREHTIYRMDVYAGLFADGEYLGTRAEQNSTEIIPMTSLRYQTYLYIKKHLGYSD